MPNLFSIARILMAFLLVIKILERDFFWALLILSGAATSDFLDGFLARKYNATSRFGSIIDPLADKILMMAAYGTLWHMDLIQGYVCLVVLGRDVLIMLTVLLCAMKKIPITFSPLMLSKVNTTLQLLYIIFVIYCNCFLINVPFAQVMILIFGGIVAVSTLFSGLEYARKYNWIKGALCKK
ncbi:MAG: CDP-alcohol phosphatidyltransferase family protein [Holosporaceae bacterium]|nr:CDP-alcohol phosphatidyltransferase family protein [Holosporaceae bacterium]